MRKLHVGVEFGRRYEGCCATSMTPGHVITTGAVKIERSMTIEPKAPIAPTESISPLYEQIVEDFLARAEKDDAIPHGTLKRIRAAFAAGPPKAAALVDAFSADDDFE